MKTKTIKRDYHLKTPATSKARYPRVGDIVEYFGDYLFVSEFVLYRKYKPKICGGTSEACDSAFTCLVHFGPFVCSTDSLSFVRWSSDSSRAFCFAFWRFK